MNFFLALMTLVFSSLAVADSLDRLHGEWVSPDGMARQVIEPELDGSWLRTRMWFRVDDQWELVAVGGLYRKPGQDAWIGISRTIMMDGIELFESTLHSGEDRYLLQNVASMADGSTLVTEEDWTFDGDDQYSYVVYKLDQGREPWIRGSWRRVAQR